MKQMNAIDAIHWLVNNPMGKLYDEYGNHIIWGPYSNVIEFYRRENADDNDHYANLERYSVQEFLKNFNDSKFNTL